MLSLWLYANNSYQGHSTVKHYAGLKALKQGFCSRCPPLPGRRNRAGQGRGGGIEVGEEGRGGLAEALMMCTSILQDVPTIDPPSSPTDLFSSPLVLSHPYSSEQEPAKYIHHQTSWTTIVSFIVDEGRSICLTDERHISPCPLWNSPQQYFATCDIIIIDHATITKYKIAAHIKSRILTNIVNNCMILNQRTTPIGPYWGWLSHITLITWWTVLVNPCFLEDQHWCSQYWIFSNRVIKCLL